MTVYELYTESIEGHAELARLKRKTAETYRELAKMIDEDADSAERRARELAGRRDSMTAEEAGADAGIAEGGDA